MAAAVKATWSRGCFPVYPLHHSLPFPCFDDNIELFPPRPILSLWPGLLPFPTRTRVLFPGPLIFFLEYSSHSLLFELLGPLISLFNNSLSASLRIPTLVFFPSSPLTDAGVPSFTPGAQCCFGQGNRIPHGNFFCTRKILILTRTGFETDDIVLVHYSLSFFLKLFFLRHVCALM